jgi:hypothetical protein
MQGGDLWWRIGLGATAASGLILWYVLRKGRARAGDHVYRASRLTAGNRIFPAQVIVTPSSVTLLKPQWVGKREESRHIAHVASISIDTNLIFSDVQIETTGGRNPLVCYGHTKGDALRIKAAIERFQTEYYRKPDTGR